MENQVSYLLPFSTNSLTGYIPLMSGKKIVLDCCAPIPIIKNLNMPIPCIHKILFLDFSLAKIDLTISYCCEKIMTEKMRKSTT